ncbi:mechanosensitive ion channel [Candidatus Woesearchaeota archaeon]|nr:mechanosensitive ion channel [Candidatus Woesearchaeota archaeon]
MANNSIASEILSENVWYLNQMFSQIATKTVVSLIILLIGFIIGRLVGRVSQKLLHELELDRILRKSAGIKISMEAVAGHGISYLIYFFSIITALSQLGLTTTVLNMISAGIIILIIVSVFLSVKDYIPNFLAGLVIIRKELVRPGEYIRTRNLEGRVIHIDIFETRLETKQKDVIYIPNSLLVKNEIVKVRKKSKQPSPKG